MLPVGSISVWSVDPWAAFPPIPFGFTYITIPNRCGLDLIFIVISNKSEREARCAKIEKNYEGGVRMAYSLDLRKRVIEYI